MLDIPDEVKATLIADYSKSHPHAPKPGTLVTRKSDGKRCVFVGVNHDGEYVTFEPDANINCSGGDA